MVETSYTVTGMTCQHCVRSVTEEISRIDNVSEVSVDLPTGVVTVRSSEAVSDGDVAEAVSEAGYEVAS